MTTTDTIHQYFTSLTRKRGWDAFLADDLSFSNNGDPAKQVTGKAAYLESTRRFFAMVTTVELKELIVDGDRACALSRYELRGPDGRAFDSHVAEVIRVREGKIASLAIYFDTAPYPKPPEAAKVPAKH